jgi:hypothetical protein
MGRGTAARSRPSRVCVIDSVAVRSSSLVRYGLFRASPRRLISQNTRSRSLAGMYPRCSAMVTEKAMSMLIAWPWKNGVSGTSSRVGLQVCP